MAYTGDKKREYQRNWIANRRQKAIDLLGGQCVECSSTEELELDHINPEIKEQYMARLWSRSWDTILKELEKCQILCKTCHKIKTSDYYTEIRKHGTNTMYKHGCSCTLCKAEHARINAKYR